MRRDAVAGAAAAAGLDHARLDLARGADDAVARRLQHLDAAVELVGLAGEQGVHGGVEAQRLRRLRHVVHLAVGDHDDAGQPVGRGVGERAVEVGEEVGAGRGLAGRLGGGDPAHLQVAERGELGLELAPDGRRLLGPAGDGLARALVDDDDGDVGEALALLLPQRRIGERQQQRRQRQRAQQGAAAAPEQQQRHQHDRQRRARPEQGGRHHRREVDRPAAHVRLIAQSPSPMWGGVRGGGSQDGKRSAIPPSPDPPPQGGGDVRLRSCATSLPEPLQQRRHVHQVGLVVAGQRVHDDVDAGAEGHLALALAAGHDRIERLVAVIARPGGGEDRST